MGHARAGRLNSSKTGLLFAIVSDNRPIFGPAAKPLAAGHGNGMAIWKMQMKILIRAAVLSVSLAAAACGGSDGPRSPSAPAPIPAADACNALGTLSSTFDARIGILSGAVCSPDRGPVMKLNMRNATGDAVGSCTGTVVMPRVVLTAAHCLDEDVAIVRVWPGVGPEFVAESFVYFPGYRFNVSGFDVGVIFMSEDLPRAAVPVLWSRAGRVGDPAIIAGWGRDETSVTFNLRAGSTTLSAVTEVFLQTPFAPPSSSVCSGDSGGPILLQEGGTWAIAGITSATSGSACNEGTNFFQAIRHPAVRNFITEHVPAIGQR